MKFSNKKNRPVVIVDPLSSGIELAPAFRARGIPVIAVTLKYLERMGFGNHIQTSDFIAIIPEQAKLEEILKEYNPIAIIAGTESAVPIVERLVPKLTPHLANDPKKYLHRLHKGYMQKALVTAGLATIKTLDTADEVEVENWIRVNGLIDSPLVIKPPKSAGSDKVFHISRGENWKKPFQRILNEASKITRKVSETVIVQEEAIGVEFAVGTVSVDGKHCLTHLMKYTKTSSGERKTIFDHVEFVAYSEEIHKELFDYTKKALDALGIYWGAAHTEIMLTTDGPRLIESGARMIGGPTVEFSRAATGSSQADKIVEAYIDGEIQKETYDFKSTVMPVFLKSPASGVVSNAEVFDHISLLPTLLNKFIWFENGSRVSQTVDYLTSIGIIALTGDREAIFRDYQKIRKMESNLVIL